MWQNLKGPVPDHFGLRLAEGDSEVSVIGQGKA